MPQYALPYHFVNPNVSNSHESPPKGKLNSSQFGRIMWSCLAAVGTTARRSAVLAVVPKAAKRSTIHALELLKLPFGYYYCINGV